MAYAVARRRYELGVRLVLGATPARLMALVLQQGLQLGGLGIGLAAATALSRIMQRVLFETSPHEPLVYAVVTLLVLVATLLASWLPARRAARVDPIIALRCE
ncbi:MAG: hypothetical protein A3G75_06935 [Verrucomicrobia bacterium RIFCSPLOWO2_12_FULL_64_8]|nr:MAG: hypothetical protein A3G75_06935 [Verrucomicrobia bacterium RIFCSPLOWO2_12_FULL_64_8]